MPKTTEVEINGKKITIRRWTHGEFMAWEKKWKVNTEMMTIAHLYAELQKAMMTNNNHAVMTLHEMIQQKESELNMRLAEAYVDMVSICTGLSTDVIKAMDTSEYRELLMKVQSFIEDIPENPYEELHNRFMTWMENNLTKNMSVESIYKMYKQIGEEIITGEFKKK